MRLLAELRPLYEPRPPALEDLTALADYAQALSTGSSPHTGPRLSELAPAAQAAVRTETSSKSKSKSKSCSTLAPEAGTCPPTATKRDQYSPGAASDPCTKSRKTSKPHSRLKYLEAYLECDNGLHYHQT